MGVYDRLLVPTDGSAGMERVIAHAEDLASVHEASVHGLYVIDATSFTGLPMETSWEGIRGTLESRGETALEEVERVVEEVPVETTTVEGTPSREIVRFATERPVDCIVMGTHGRGGIDRLLLGSVAERVVRGSPVPVVTVNVTDSSALADGTEQPEQVDGTDETTESVATGTE